LNLIQNEHKYCSVLSHMIKHPQNSWGDRFKKPECFNLI
jgi:hypothetical protein